MIEIAGKPYWQEGLQSRPFQYVLAPARKYLPPDRESARCPLAAVRHTTEVQLEDSQHLVSGPLSNIGNCCMSHRKELVVDFRDNPTSHRRTCHPDRLR